MRRIVLITTMAVLVALSLLVSVGFASAKPKGHVVHPGDSIQKAIKATDPGDTIVVLGGVHHETVAIKKDGISLRGVDAVLKPPAKPTSCGGSGFCVKADNVSISGFTVRNFPGTGIIAMGTRNAKFMTNRAINNGEYGIAAYSTTGTHMIANQTSGSDDAGLYVGDSPHADATVAANETYDNFLGILVRNARHGKIVGNQVHNNCLGMMFLADEPGPAGVFDVRGNKVVNNTRACPAFEDAPPLSGIGIALLGARGMEIKSNQIMHNVPSGPTGFSGGVVVTKGFKGTPPTNNTITGNTILRNKPDIFWDKSGSGNRFKPNDCKTSKPGRLCKG
ncbi:MAG TPA: right-handed parallel beta-helix repeat-containing protein [Rubrobacter sp.]|nr:right-handed parallel beta-helix repeat-containing protein [Rubrobacter sp.]